MKTHLKEDNRMKKIIAMLLTLSLMLSLIGCVEKREKNEETTGGDTVEQTRIALGYEVAVSRVGYADDDIIYTYSVNNSDYGNGDTKYRPVYVCRSLSELEAFKETFDGVFSMQYSIGSIPSFAEATAVFDDAFFAVNTLVMVYQVAGSGSYRFGLDRYEVNDGAFTAHIIQTNHPGSGTCDMAGWLISIPVPNEVLAGVDSFSTVYDGYKNPKLDLDVSAREIETIEVSTLPENDAYKRTVTSVDEISKIIGYLNFMQFDTDFSENPGEYSGMTIIMDLYRDDGSCVTVYFFGNMFLRVDDGPWLRMDHDEADALYGLVMP